MHGAGNQRSEANFEQHRNRASGNPADVGVGLSLWRRIMQLEETTVIVH